MPSRILFVAHLLDRDTLSSGLTYCWPTPTLHVHWQGGGSFRVVRVVITLRCVSSQHHRLCCTELYCTRPIQTDRQASRQGEGRGEKQIENEDTEET